MLGRSWVGGAAVLAIGLAFAGCSGDSFTACESSRECSASGLVCDRALGRCVECVTSTDCLAAGEVCRASQCDVVTPCVSSRECPGLVCDASRGYCVECVADIDCPTDERCDGEGFCETRPPPCSSDRMCSEAGLVCDTIAGECVECVRAADCGVGEICAEHRCRTDEGPRFDAGRDAGPSVGDAALSDAGPRDAGPFGFDAGPRDGGPRDAGPRDAGPMCLPGSLVIVFDASGSMADTPDDTTPTTPAGSRGALTASALNTWLAGLPDALRVGLVTYPNTLDVCGVDATPRVSVGPLSTNRAPIATAIAATPSGNSPMLAALDRAYDLALTTSTAGPRAVLLLSDGNNCDNPMAATILARVATMRTMGIKTYVLGLTVENGLFSRIAIDGGTRINGSCIAACSADLCATDADCGGTTTCELSTFVGSMECECSTGVCPSPLSCITNPDPFGVPMVCSGDANCCSHHARASTYDGDLAASLNLVAADFVSFCP